MELRLWKIEKPNDYSHKWIREVEARWPGLTYEQSLLFGIMAWADSPPPPDLPSFLQVCLAEEEEELEWLKQQGLREEAGVLHEISGMGFHSESGTSIRVRGPQDRPFVLSPSQSRRLDDMLCPWPDCLCGGRFQYDRDSAYPIPLRMYFGRTWSEKLRAEAKAFYDTDWRDAWVLIPASRRAN